jgi:hypothetical protein
MVAPSTAVRAEIPIEATKSPRMVGLTKAARFARVTAPLVSKKPLPTARIAGTARKSRMYPPNGTRPSRR